MRKLTIIILIVFSCTLIYAQQKTDLSVTWIQTIPADTTVGIQDNSYIFNLAPDGYFEIYENEYFSIIIMEGGFINGEMNGLWTFYHNNIIYEKIFFVNGLKQGPYSAYYPSGQIKIAGNYENGMLEGEYIIYNEDGSIRVKYFMHNGIIEE